MIILITGGAGYVGTPLVDLLCENPQVEKVFVYDNLSRSNFNLFIGARKEEYKKLTFIRGELLDSRKLKKVLKDIDIVYHLAARVTTPFANSDAHLFDQINHWGTAELTYLLEESSVKKLIFTSSAGIYGASSDRCSSYASSSCSSPSSPLVTCMLAHIAGPSASGL